MLDKKFSKKQFEYLNKEKARLLADDLEIFIIESVRKSVESRLSSIINNLNEEGFKLEKIQADSYLGFESAKEVIYSEVNNSNQNANLTIYVGFQVCVNYGYFHFDTSKKIDD